VYERLLPRGEGHLLTPLHHPPEVRVRLVADVEPGRHLRQLRLRQVVADAAGLVGGERVHRVQQYGLHAAPAQCLLPSAVVELGDQERLGLAGSGAGLH
jgi:hypothetical protein